MSLYIQQCSLETSPIISEENPQSGSITRINNVWEKTTLKRPLLSVVSLVVSEYIYATLPRTQRGQPIVLGGDPKGKNFLYTNGNSVIIRNIEVRYDLSRIQFTCRPISNFPVLLLYDNVFKRVLGR